MALAPHPGRSRLGRNDRRDRRDPDPDPAARRSRGERVSGPGRDLGMAKKIDPKAKAKRQKIYAGVGGVILLAVLAFQARAHLEDDAPVDGDLVEPGARDDDQRHTDADQRALAGRRQRRRVDGRGCARRRWHQRPRCASGRRIGPAARVRAVPLKDPFAQQLTQNGATGATGVTPVSSGATGPTGPATGSGAVVSKPAAQPVSASTAPAAASTTAAISVNGAPESVKVGGAFPAANPYFKLVSLTKKGAKVSIAGGSLENGAPTVTLTKNKALTLMNTADGTRYVLRLVSTS